MITRRPVKAKPAARKNGGGLTELLEGLGFRIRAAGPGRCAVLAGDGTVVLDNVTADEIWAWLRKGGKSGGGSNGAPAEKKLGREITDWRTAVLSVLQNAHDELKGHPEWKQQRTKGGAHFGSKKDKQALRRLIKDGFAKVTHEEPGGVEGVEIYALPTPAGLRVIEAGYRLPAKKRKASKKKKPAKKGNPSKKKKAAKKRKPAKKKKATRKKKKAGHRSSATKARSSKKIKGQKKKAKRKTAKRKTTKARSGAFGKIASGK